MSARTCASCANCLLRPGSAAKAAPCAVRMAVGAPSFYVEVDAPADCRTYVGRADGDGAWTDAQRLELARAADHMQTVTGHQLAACIAEMARAVCEHVSGGEAA